MKVEAEDLIKYHCPRWNELPQIDLYIDQVICILQSNLSIFLKDNNTPIITASMINNYVKQNVIEAPVKKKYNRMQLSHLFVICILKRLMSISEIKDSIETIKKTCTVEDGYNMFCDELEKSLRKAFCSDEDLNDKNEKNNTREYETLRAMVSAFSNCVLVDRLILLRK